ncbi:MAG: HAD-IC family P-type ATPase, partial [Firmicutes bacterium]|nr:HAD-IC family P-type ATPase [Bacillota bacterium]
MKAKNQEQKIDLAQNPGTPEFSGAVLADGVRVKDPNLAFARGRGKRETQFAQAMAAAVRHKPDCKAGLTPEQVAERKAKSLTNFAPKSNAKTYSSIFFQNIFTFFNLLCVTVAVGLTFAQTSIANYFFLIIMLINMTISIILEIRAKWTLEKLSLISAPVAVAVRGGEKTSVPTGEVVLDDILFLENGNQICTDCILVSGEVEVNESLLTGESNSVLKKEGCRLFAGSFITGGNCYARADRIASDNYIEGLTAFAKRYKKAKSELLDSLRTIIKIIGILIFPLAGLLLYTNITALRLIDPDVRIFEAFPMTAGAVIGMIPSGMFLLTSTALALSVIRLSKNNVLVQDLYCIEMLARVNVLCLDKTGTITDGTMQVNEVVEFKNSNDTGYTLDDIIGSCLTATGDNNQTAIALIDKFGYSKALKPVGILPFSSQRKFSAVTFEDAGTFFMGAPEFILNDMGVRLETLINNKAKEGLRVMLVAHSAGSIKNDRPPSNPKAVALIIIEDHIRED